MGKLNARTEWEVDAARRREVVEADMAAARHRRQTVPGAVGHKETSEGGLLATLRALVGAPAEAAAEAPSSGAGATGAS